MSGDESMERSWVPSRSPIEAFRQLPTGETMRKSILGWVASSTFALGCSSTNDTTSLVKDAGNDATSPIEDAGAKPLDARVVAHDAGAAVEAGGPEGGVGLQKLNHVVVILLENWSFDSLYA